MLEIAKTFKLSSKMKINESSKVTYATLSW